MDNGSNYDLKVAYMVELPHSGQIWEIVWNYDLNTNEWMSSNINSGSTNVNTSTSSDKNSISQQNNNVNSSTTMAGTTSTTTTGAGNISYGYGLTPFGPFPEKVSGDFILTQHK